MDNSTPNCLSVIELFPLIGRVATLTGSASGFGRAAFIKTDLNRDVHLPCLGSRGSGDIASFRLGTPRYPTRHSALVFPITRAIPALQFRLLNQHDERVQANSPRQCQSQNGRRFCHKRNSEKECAAAHAEWIAQPAVWVMRHQPMRHKTNWWPRLAGSSPCPLARVMYNHPSQAATRRGSCTLTSNSTDKMYG